MMPTALSARHCFHEFADCLPHLAWMADRGGSIYWHNRHWCDYTGEDLQGWSWLTLIQPEHADRVTAQWRAAVSAGNLWHDTFPLRRSDGAYRWFLFRAVPIREGGAAVARWYGTGTDVTERIAVEDELQRANRRKDTVLAWLGHELRNPLTPILTSAHLLTMMGPNDPNLQKARDTIIRQTLQLSNLIDDLLDASRTALGKLRLRKTHIQLTPLITQAVEACRDEIERRHHRLDVTLAHDEIVVDADGTRIVQMISNLLTNAAKYMRDGGVIQLTTELQGASAVVRVRDQGIGIAPEVLTRVFEPYVQVGVGPMHSQGLGMGLALVKSIVEGHGGTVEARSEGPDRGSEFIARLPRCRPPTR